jgi:hypothetical protein
MSYIQEPNFCPELGYCAALLKGIEGINGSNNTSMKPTPVGVLQALTDNRNRVGASYEIQGPNGNLQRIRVKRLQRSTRDEVVDGNTCDITTTKSYIEQHLDCTLSGSISFETTDQEMKLYCAEMSSVESVGGTNVFADTMSKIMSAMNGLREYVNEKIIDKLSTNVGVNVTTANNLPTGVQVVDAVNGAKIEKGIQDILFDMTNNQIYGQPFVVGLGNFDRFNTSANWGCCNQFGLNWQAMVQGAPYVYYQDTMLGDLVSDDNRIFVFAPGSTQFISYSANAMVRKLSQDQRHGDTRYGYLVDPLAPGLWYDLAIQETNCKDGMREPSWIVTLSCHFDVAIQPLNAYKPSDRLYGTNGILWYQAQAV